MPAKKHQPQPAIAMKAVKSSSVDSHGYDAATKTLAVKYQGGGVYHYAGVPQDLADRIAKAESVGRFIATDLKPKFTGVLQKQ